MTLFDHVHFGQNVDMTLGASECDQCMGAVGVISRAVKINFNFIQAQQKRS